jgi:hypothetical protein
MPIPDGARRTLERRLEQRRRERWPDLHDLSVRYRAPFAYVAGADEDGPLPLFRLRYLGSPTDWGFAIYLASKDGYEDSVLPSGMFTGTPEDALDCACGLYLGDITAWLEPPPDDAPDSRGNF